MTTASLNTYYCYFCDQISNYYNSWKKRIKDDIDNKRGAAQLSYMSDHALKDIGLTRGDIPAIKAGTYVSYHRGGR